MNYQSHKILGCPCIAMHENEAAAKIISLLREKKAGYTVAINAEKIQRFSTDPILRNVILNSILPYPDGAGAVLGLKWLFGVASEKINMPIAALAAADNARLRVFIIGAQEISHKVAVERIKQDYPNIHLVGTLHGFHSQELMISQVLLSRPQMVLIAMGSPKQELFAAELMAQAKFGVAIGCGGALDILSGSLKRAPDFMINNNLEWFYRLYLQPRRLTRQLFLPLFLVRLLASVTYRKFVRIFVKK